MPRLVKISIVSSIIYQCSITKLRKNSFNLSTQCPRPPPRRSRLAITLPHSLHSGESYNCRPLFKAKLHPAMISEPMAQTRSKHRCQTNLKIYIAIYSKGKPKSTPQKHSENSPKPTSRTSPKSISKSIPKSTRKGKLKPIPNSTLYFAIWRTFGARWGDFSDAVLNQNWIRKWTRFLSRKPAQKLF